MAIKRKFILPSGIGISANDIYIVGSTDSTNTTTGSLVMAGGVGIGQSVNIGGRVGIGTNLLTGQINIRTSSASTPGLVVQGSTSQTADYAQFYTSTGTTSLSITKDAEIKFPLAQDVKLYATAYGSVGAIKTTGNFFAYGGLIFAYGVSDELSGYLSATAVSVSGLNWSTYSSGADIRWATNNPVRIQPTGTTVVPLVINNQSASWTSGNAFEIANNGVLKYSIDYAGSTSIASTTGSGSTTTGALKVTGGVGIGGSIFGGSTISAADNIEIKSGKELRLNNSGNTFYTGLKAGSNASNTTYTLPTAFPGTGTSVLQSDTSGTLTWVGIVGNATTATNINVISASTSANHPVLFTPATGSASGAAVSSETSFVYNPSTDILSVSGLAVTSGTASTSSTTGALVVTGGAGFGGTLNVGGDLNILTRANQTPVLGGFAGSTGWTSAGLLSGAANYALAFGNGLFVSIRKTTNSTSFSPDGRQWVGSTMPFTGDWMSIAWGVDKFVAVASAGTTGAYSGNGITWTSMNMPSTAQGWYAVTYGDDKFVAVGNTSTTAYSSDGISWTGSSIANTNWTGVAYGNGTFVAVAGFGQSGAYSYDGINWNLSNLPTNGGGIKFITYGNGYFIVTNYVSTAINYSRDGINWSTSTRTSTFSIHTDLAYGNGVYSIFNYQEASYSYDAINWLNGNTITATDWQAVAYGNNRFVATSYNTSYVGSIDGPSNTLNLHPKFTGDIDNVRIGSREPAAAEFTNLAAQQPVRFTDNTISNSVNSGALVVVGGVGIGQSVSVGGRLQMFNGANYTAFISSASGNTVYTLPATSPATGSSVLQSTSAGLMSWVAMSAAGGLAISGSSDGTVQFKSGSSLVSRLSLFFDPLTLGLRISGFPGGETPSSTSAALKLEATVGSFNGSVNGTYYAANAPTAFAGDLMNLQVNAVSKFRIDNTGAIIQNIGTNSTSTTSGAVQIKGGIGITGAVFVGESINATSTTTSTNTTTGALIVSGGVGIAGTVNIGADLVISGLTTLTYTSEKLNTKTSATGTVTHDLSTGSIFYHSSISSNFTANITNVPTTNDRAIGVTLVLAQGVTAYMSTALQIAGSAQTINWVNNSIPAGTASKVDIVGFSLIRTGSAWTVLGQYSTYG